MTLKTRFKERLNEKLMEYTFLYELDKVPQHKRKEILPTLTDSQLKLLYYIYFVKLDIEHNFIREAILTQEVNPNNKSSLDSIITNILAGEVVLDDLVEDILSYIARVEFYAGPVEAKKAAKVIFHKKRVVGIKAKDILKEIDSRKEK